MADGLRRRATIGVFGGTFDPPHLGHLAAAQEASDVAGLERVLFVPTRRNPLKHAAPISAAEHRLAMTALAARDNPRFGVSDADLGGTGASYTVDLLERLHAELGATHALAFIVGTDVLPQLHLWREPLRVLELAHLVAVSRPGQELVEPGELATRLPGAARVTVVRTPGVAISSTELRARFAEGRPVRYLAPEAVIAYVAEHRLYRPPVLPARGPDSEPDAGSRSTQCASDGDSTPSV